MSLQLLASVSVSVCEADDVMPEPCAVCVCVCLCAACLKAPDVLANQFLLSSKVGGATASLVTALTTEEELHSLLTGLDSAH